MKLADRLSQIKPSPTLAISAKARAMKIDGKDIISLSAGEPDFDTPDFAKEAGIKAIKEGETKYTSVDGTTYLKSAVSDKFRNDNDLDYDLDQIIVGTGAKQILFNAFLATVNPKDEVIIPAPYWVSYPEMVRIAEGDPILIKTSEKKDFKITPDALEKALTKNTKWVIINSPNNPTGSMYTQEEFKALGKVLEKHPNVYILSDEIYEHITYGQQFYSFAQACPNLFERTLTVNGISKAYAMTGWRIGYAGGPKNIVSAMKKIQSQSTSNACSISQAAAAVALKGDHSFIKDRNAEFEKRRNYIVKELNTIDGMTCLEPKGAFYVYPNCKGFMGKKTPSGSVIENDTDFAEFLLDHAQVAVVPGSAFGYSPYIRMSYATSLDLIIEALKRIKKACSNLI